MHCCIITIIKHIIYYTYIQLKISRRHFIPAPSKHMPIQRNLFLHSLLPEWNVMKHNIKHVQPFIISTKHHFWGAAAQQIKTMSITHILHNWKISLSQHEQVALWSLYVIMLRPTSKYIHATLYSTSQTEKQIHRTLYKTRSEYVWSKKFSSQRWESRAGEHKKYL